MSAPKLHGTQPINPRTGCILDERQSVSLLQILYDIWGRENGQEIELTAVRFLGDEEFTPVSEIMSAS